MRTRPSFTNFPISLRASDLATSKTRSPFCSVQTLTAMSPLPIGMESFSLVPRVDQVTSFGATNLSKTLCSAAAERQIRKDAKSAICDFIVSIPKSRPDLHLLHSCRRSGVKRNFRAVQFLVADRVAPFNRRRIGSRLKLGSSDQTPFSQPVSRRLNRRAHRCCGWKAHQQWTK